MAVARAGWGPAASWLRLACRRPAVPWFRLLDGKGGLGTGGAMAALDRREGRGGGTKVERARDDASSETNEEMRVQGLFHPSEIKKKLKIFNFPLYLEIFYATGGV